MSTTEPHSLTNFSIDEVSYNVQLDYHSNTSADSYILEHTITNREVSAAASYTVGCLMAVVFILGVCENGTVLFVFSRSQKVRTSNMAFVIGLSLSDTGQTVLNIPFVICSCFSRKWIFGDAGCAYIGFVTTWFGVTQISLLCVIAVERYFIIVRRARKFSASLTRTKATIATCFIYGAFWALCPVLGWSEYKLVAGEISCSLNWSPENNVNLSYTLSLFSAVWFLPLSLITFAYIKIAKLVYNQKEKRLNLGGKTKTKRERRVAITMLIMIGAFVLSWTPYSVVALMSIFGNLQNASSVVYLVPAAFAKASIVWNPIIYIARHKEFRRACIKSYRKLLAELHVYENSNFSTSNNDRSVGKDRQANSEESSNASSKRHTVLRSRLSISQNTDSYLSIEDRSAVPNITVEDNVQLLAQRQMRGSSEKDQGQTYSHMEGDDSPNEGIPKCSNGPEMQENAHVMSNDTIMQIFKDKRGLQSNCSNSALTESAVSRQDVDYNISSGTCKRECLVKTKYYNVRYDPDNSRECALNLEQRVSKIVKRQQGEKQVTKFYTMNENDISYKKTHFSGKQNGTLLVTSLIEREGFNCLQLSPKRSNSRTAMYQKSMEQPITKCRSRLKNDKTGRMYKVCLKPPHSSDNTSIEMKEMSSLNQKFHSGQGRTNVQRYFKEEPIPMHEHVARRVDNNKFVFNSKVYLDLEYDSLGNLIRQSIV